MSHHTASLQFTLGKTATAFDLARTAANRLYWLDDTYVQPFYSWAAPRIRDVAISGLCWTMIALIETALWLIDTTLQYMNRDIHAIALHSFAHAHEPLPEFPALPPAAVPLALPSMAHTPIFPSPVVRWIPTPEALGDATPVLALCSMVGPIAFNSFVPDDSVRSWLTAALPLVLAPWVNEAVPVSPAVVPVLPSITEAPPVVKKSRQSKATDTKKGTGKATNKTPRKRSQQTTAQ